MPGVNNMQGDLFNILDFRYNNIKRLCNFCATFFSQIRRVERLKTLANTAFLMFFDIAFFAYGPEGQGFESLGVRHRKALKTRSFQGFSYILNILWSSACATFVQLFLNMSSS